MNWRSIRKIFQRSPQTHRPVLEWIWNSEPDPERAAAFADAVLENGYGGIWLRPDSGFSNDDASYATLNAVAKRLRRKRASVWLHERIDHPHASDYSAQLRDRNEWQLHAILPAIVPRDEIAWEKTVAAFSLQAKQRNGEPTPTWEALDPCAIGPRIFHDAPDDNGSEFAIAFCSTANPMQSNPFRADATEAILEDTIAHAFSQSKKYFGNTIGLALFGDLGYSIPENSVLWDPDLPNLYNEAFDENIEELLPALFYDTDRSAEIRHDFCWLISGMLREGLVFPIRRWCEQHKIAWAGNIVPTDPTASSPAVVQPMSMLAFEDFPTSSTAWDGEQIGIRDVFHLKEAVSVNHQLRKHGVICLNDPLPELPPDTAALRRHSYARLVLGGTYLTHAGAPLSLRGDRKECGPSISPQQPFWPYLRPALDAMSRSSWVLSQGYSVCSVLLIRPASPTPRGTLSQPENALGPRTLFEHHLLGITETLLDAQVDFDLGDERILAEQSRASHQNLVVGDHVYSYIVVPPCDSLRATTFRLLQDFATGGGKVIFVGSAPRFLDGRPSGEWKKFLEHYGERICDGPDLSDYSGLVEQLSRWDARAASVDAANPGSCLKGLWIQRRRWEDSDVTFMANVGLRRIEAVWNIAAKRAESLEEWNIETGKQTVRASLENSESIEIPIHLESGESKLWVTMPGNSGEAVPVVEFSETRHASCDWTGRRTQPNAVHPVTDSIAIEGSPASDEIREAVRARLNETGGELVDVRVQSSFQWQGTSPESSCYALVDATEISSILCDEEKLSPEPSFSPLGADFVAYRIPPPAAGRHTITLAATIASHVDIPWIYLFGEFVSEGGILQSASDSIALGSWSDQGLARYSGNVVYTGELQGYKIGEEDRVVLDASGLHGPAQVRVNGNILGHILWPPYTCDISEAWKPGPLTIEIELAGDLRSLLRSDFKPDFGLMEPAIVRILSPKRSIASNESPGEPDSGKA